MIPPVDVIQQYAPNVAPQTIAHIIRIESSGNQYAVGVNSRKRIRLRPRSAQEAASLARRYISKGYSVDLGLMQINSKNVQKLGYTIEEILDPSTNIKVGARILTKAYAGAVKRFGPGQAALRAALSAYNTGSYTRGYKNGYVAKYFGGSSTKDGNTYILKTPAPSVILSSVSKTVSSSTEPIDPYTTELTVYNQEQPVSSQNISQLQSLE